MDIILVVGGVIATLLGIILFQNNSKNNAQAKLANSDTQKKDLEVQKDQAVTQHDINNNKDAAEKQDKERDDAIEAAKNATIDAITKFWNKK